MASSSFCSFAASLHWRFRVSRRCFKSCISWCSNASKSNRGTTTQNNAGTPFLTLRTIPFPDSTIQSSTVATSASKMKRYFQSKVSGHSTVPINVAGNGRLRARIVIFSHNFNCRGASLSQLIYASTLTFIFLGKKETCSLDRRQPF